MAVGSWTPKFCWLSSKSRLFWVYLSYRTVIKNAFIYVSAKRPRRPWRPNRMYKHVEGLKASSLYPSPAGGIQVQVKLTQQNTHTALCYLNFISLVDIVFSPTYYHSWNMFYNGPFPKTRFFFLKKTTFGTYLCGNKVNQLLGISVACVSVSTRMCFIPILTACIGLHSVFYSFTPATLTSDDLDVAGMLTHGGIF